MFAECGGAARELANVLNEGFGLEGITRLRADADALYWAAEDSVAGHCRRRLELREP